MAKSVEPMETPGVIGMVTLIFGIMAEVMSRDPFWRWFSYAAVGMIAYHFAPDPRWKIKTLFKSLKLYFQDDDKDWFPRIFDEHVLENGKEYVMTLPPGICSDDFKKNEQRLSEGLGAHVETRYENGTIRMKILENKLMSKYDYEVIETKNPVEIPIGYGYEGLHTLTFSDQVSALLVGGYPGSGKSVFLRQAIVNLILTKSPSDLQLYLVDLKNGVEFEMFKRVEHVAGFAKNESEAMKLFKYLEYLTEERYKQLSKANVVNITEYDKKRKMDYHLVVIDEYANLRENKEIQAKVDKLLRVCRAVGIYFIVCTQRPSAETVPGLIKANTQSVLAFAVKNQVNSRILLDNDKAADIEIPGRAIYQQGSKDKDVQVMFLPDAKARRLIMPYCRKQIPEAKNNRGVEKC